MRITTRDGAPLLVRSIAPDDKASLVHGFERLSPQSRYQRFLAPVKRLGERELTYLTEVDHHDHEALVGLTPEGEIVAVARYVRLEREPSVAEAAIVVLDEWQGRGVGTALLDRLAARAGEAGIGSFKAVCFAWNKDVIDLFDALGPHMEVGAERDGLVQLDVELPTSDESEALRGGLRALAAGRLRHGGSPVNESEP